MSNESQIPAPTNEIMVKPLTAAAGSIRIKKSTHLNSLNYRHIDIQQPLPRSKNISRQSMGGGLQGPDIMQSNQQQE
jgi:hypothetical protein